MYRNNKGYPPLDSIFSAKALRLEIQEVIQRIEGSELDAFSWVQREPTSIRSESAAERLVELPLSGLPIAVKEVIDVVGAPIGYGCRAFSGRYAAENADIVNQLEGLGAQVIGITRSTEMAIAKETTTLNPWSREHSPGASSSGSAAAVGAGLVPFALGTQTIGSVIRPAAYCGVPGFKPSAGLGSLGGVLSLSDTLDHVGYFADSLERMTSVLSLLFPEISTTPIPQTRFVFIEPWFDCESAQHFSDQTAVLKAACSDSNIDWTEKVLPTDFAKHEAELVTTLLCFEMYKKWGGTLLGHPETSDFLQEFLRSGASITESEYELALERRHQMIAEFEGFMADGDVVVFPSVTGLPPKLGEGTGARDPQRLWTLLGLPALNLPVGWNEGFPFNLQLIGKRGADLHLLKSAALVNGIFRRETIRHVGA